MDSQTAKGHQEPLSVQFSVFLANRVGHLRDLLEVFSSEDVMVLGFSVVDSADWAVVRIVLDNPNRARAVLQKNSVPFTESPVLLVELPSIESLTEICDHLLRAEMNIHFSYPLMIQSRSQPVLVLHVDDPILSSHILSRHGYTLLDEEDT